MPSARVYVDTNVFIRLFEARDELSNALSELFLIGHGVEGEAPLVTSELTLAELLVVPYRDGDTHLMQLYDAWTQSNDSLEVGPIHRNVLYYAAIIRAQFGSLKLPDAIHISTAVGTRCSRLLSADMGLRDRYEVRHERDGRLFGPVAVEVIRPNLTVVRDLVEEFGSP